MVLSEVLFLKNLTGESKTLFEGTGSRMFCTRRRIDISYLRWCIYNDDVKNKFKQAGTELGQAQLPAKTKSNYTKPNHKQPYQTKQYQTIPNQTIPKVQGWTPDYF